MITEMHKLITVWECDRVSFNIKTIKFDEDENLYRAYIEKKRQIRCRIHIFFHPKETIIKLFDKCSYGSLQGNIILI